MLGIVFAPWLVSALAPGFEGEKAALTVTLTRVMYPFILLVSLAALAMGLLNARNVFGVPAMASSFFNLGSIIAGVLLGYWLDPHFGTRAILGLALGTLIGGALQLMVQLPALRRVGYRYHPDFEWRDPGVRSILRLMGPSVIAASTTQVNVLVNSVFASQLGDGPTFWLTVAFRLMQLPLGLFGVALGTVALPLLARMAATGQHRAFRIELARGMRLAFLMTVPASIGLIVLAEPIISVLYQHGRFTAYETAESAGALRFYALGLCGYAALKVLVNAFYAIDRRKTPMIVSLIAVALNLLLNWIFTLHLGWGHRGLAFSTACVATSNFLILYLLMRSHLGRLESRALAALLRSVSRSPRSRCSRLPGRAGTTARRLGDAALLAEESEPAARDRRGGRGVLRLCERAADPRSSRDRRRACAPPAPAPLTGAAGELDAGGEHALQGAAQRRREGFIPGRRPVVLVHVAARLAQIAAAGELHLQRMDTFAGAAVMARGVAALEAAVGDAREAAAIDEASSRAVSSGAQLAPEWCRDSGSAGRPRTAAGSASGSSGSRRAPPAGGAAQPVDLGGDGAMIGLEPARQARRDLLGRRARLPDGRAARRRTWRWGTAPWSPARGRATDPTDHGWGRSRCVKFGADLSVAPRPGAKS